MRTIRAPCTFLVVMTILAACSSGNVENDGRGVPPGPVVRRSPKDVVFRIDTRGGFTAPEYQLALVPEVTVYGDGRVIVNGPVTEQYPPHARSNLLTGTLSHAELMALADQAARLDLLRPRSFGNPGVSDMPTTTVTINVEGRHQLRAYAADYTLVTGDPGVSPSQRDARRRLTAMMHALTDTATKVATDRYAASEVAIYVQAGGPTAGRDTGVIPNSIEWPLGDLATLGRSDGPAVPLPSRRCIVLTGADARSALSAAANATSITRWQSHGVEYTIVWRPLLPDEHSCP